MRIQVGYSDKGASTAPNSPFTIHNNNTDNATTTRVCWGAIVRTNWGNNAPVGSTNPIGFQHIMDGTSNTLLIGEKRLDVNNYRVGDWHDDRGWTDGWDPDVVRFTGTKPAADKKGGVYFTASGSGSRSASSPSATTGRTRRSSTTGST